LELHCLLLTVEQGPKRKAKPKTTDFAKIGQADVENVKLLASVPDALVPDLHNFQLLLMLLFSGKGVAVVSSSGSSAVAVSNKRKHDDAVANPPLDPMPQPVQPLPAAPPQQTDQSPAPLQQLPQPIMVQDAEVQELFPVAFMHHRVTRAGEDSLEPFLPEDSDPETEARRRCHQSVAASNGEVPPAQWCAVCQAPTLSVDIDTQEGHLRVCLLCREVLTD